MTIYPLRKSILITPPSIEPLTLSEVKLFLRVDGTQEDSLLNSLILAARELAEKYIGHMLITQNWQMSQLFICGHNIDLVPRPVQNIDQVAIEYNGVQTVLDSSAYELNIDNMLEINNNITADKVIIDFTVGYGVAEDVPMPIKQGMLHSIGYLYHNREETASICPEAKALWEQYMELRI